MRIRFLLAFFVSWISFCVNVQGQQKFVLEIRQVFPQNKLEYGRAFDYPEDLNRTKSSQIQKLRGNANYKVDIKRPNKQDSHESIQNIKWIEIINGTKSYFKGETRPAKSYTKATIWEGYKCDLYGKQVGKKMRREFIYRVSIINSEKAFETDFVEMDSAQAQAERLYKKIFVVEQPVKVLVCKFEPNDTTIIKSFSNEEEYLAYQKQSFEKTDNERRLMQLNVERFKKEMDAIMMKKDSLKLNGVNKCQKVLTEMGTIIPDSIFIAEKLDSVYRSVLVDNILPFAKRKQIMKLDVSISNIKEQQKTDGLMNVTNEIIKILFPAKDKQ